MKNILGCVKEKDPSHKSPHTRRRGQIHTRKHGTMATAASACLRLAAATVGVTTGAGRRSCAAASTVVPFRQNTKTTTRMFFQLALHHHRHHHAVVTRRGLKSRAAAASASSSAASSAASASSAGGVTGESSSDGKLYEAIVVVAGGMTDEGTLPPWVTSRLDFTLEEYNRHVTASSSSTSSSSMSASPPPPTYVVLSGSATPHKPPAKAKGGFILHESTAMAEYLIERGVPPEHILKDTASMDTIGNAYMVGCGAERGNDGTPQLEQRARLWRSPPVEELAPEEAPGVKAKLNKKN